MDNPGADSTEHYDYQEITICKDDFAQICRSCLRKDLDLKSLSEFCDEVQVIDLLAEYSLTQISADDNLPQQICVECIDLLERLHAFRTQYQVNERALLELLEDELKDDKKDLDIEEAAVDDPLPDDDNEDDPLDLKEGDEDSEIEENAPEPSSNTMKLRRQRAMRCLDCGERFPSLDHLRLHQKAVGHSAPEVKHACNVCGKFFTRGKLSQHMRAHTKEKPFICHICKQAFSMSGNLKRHMMTHTGERPHTCEICGKGFIQASTLQTHRKTHEIDGFGKKDEDEGTSLTCDYCGRSFKRLARYNAHVQKHYSENAVNIKYDKGPRQDKPEFEYVCEICKRAYKTRHLLRNHQLTHGEKTFLCSECGKGFITNAALLSHLKVHTGEKPHKCNVCNKAFAYVSSFQAHVLIHTGHRPYSCKLCGKTFTQLAHLKYHTRTHSGERPYHCTYCNKSFALKGNLTVHVRIHTGETPYLCPVCGKGFHDSSSMKKHWRGHGPEDDTKAGIPRSEKKSSSDGEVVYEQLC